MVILLIICIILIVLLINFRKKIDREEKEALNKTGIANMLRDNYPYLINSLLSNKTHWIIKERDYDQFIIIGNPHKQELCIKYTSLGYNGQEIWVALVDHSMVVKEWKFDRSISEYSIVTELSYYFK